MRRDGFEIKHLILALIFVLVAGVLQNTDILNIYGIKPNITLTVLLTLSFAITSLSHYLFLLLIAAVLLKFEIGLEATNLVFIVLALIGFFINRKVSGEAFFNNLFLIAGATLFFYLLVDINFLYQNILTVFWEMLYNISLGALVYFSSHRFLPYEKAFRITF